jgi:hypothetical protein
MDLAEFYPSPDDLVKSEVSVLNHLRSSPYIKERHPQVAQAAADYSQRRSPFNFEFNSHFDIWHMAMHRNSIAARESGKAKPNVKLTISARINMEHKVFRDITYCLSVCRIRSNRLTVLRKFHFDVVGEAAETRRQQHPQSHIQYCGEMVPYMVALGCRETQLDQMHPWLSEPRIFYWPMSLALLIDMALREFPDQNSAKFRADSYWRGLVRSQEALVLRPFYAKCIQVIANAGGKNMTLADAFYVS